MENHFRTNYLFWVRKILLKSNQVLENAFRKSPEYSGTGGLIFRLSRRYLSIDSANPGYQLVYILCHTKTEMFL